MALAWNWFAVPGTVALLLALPMAAFVYFSAPHRAQNRYVGLLLFVDGVTWGVGGGALYFLADRPAAFGAQAVFVTGALALPFLYLLVVGTLDTPLARPFRGRAGVAAVVATGLAVQAWWLTHPERFTVDLVPAWYAPYDAVLGSDFLAWIPVLGIVSLFALVALVSAWRRSAHDTAGRAKAKAFALAFGIRDGWLVVVGLFLPLVTPPPPSGQWTDTLYFLGTAGTTIAFLLVVAYGILKAQLFDIDLRIKAGISRTTVAVAFLAVFFAGSQVAQEFLSDTFGFLVGGAAAGLLLFGLAPLQRVAQRVADAAMPGVSGDADYLAYRKVQVYRAAVEGAFQDGRITEREGEVLRRLREELRLTRETAAAVEEDVRTTSTTGSATS